MTGTSLPRAGAPRRQTMPSTRLDRVKVGGGQLDQVEQLVVHLDGGVLDVAGPGAELHKLVRIALLVFALLLADDPMVPSLPARIDGGRRR